MISEIQQLTQHLIENGFEYADNCGSTIYFNKIYDKHQWYIALTEPHSGNHYKWMLRAEREDEFDRWSNASFEEFYDDVSDFISKYLIQLDNYINSYNK